MANIKSSKERIKTNEKARERNASYRSQVRTASKKVRVAVEKKDTEHVDELLKAAFRIIDKSYNAGVYKSNTVARQKSSLQRLVNSLGESAPSEAK